MSQESPGGAWWMLFFKRAVDIWLFCWRHRLGHRLSAEILGIDKSHEYLGNLVQGKSSAAPAQASQGSCQSALRVANTKGPGHNLSSLMFDRYHSKLRTLDCRTYHNRWLDDDSCVAVKKSPPSTTEHLSYFIARTIRCPATYRDLLPERHYSRPKD